MSIKLKSHVKTPKGLQLIRPAEISLLNERIRLITNSNQPAKSTERYMYQKAEGEDRGRFSERVLTSIY